MTNLHLFQMINAPPGLGPRHVLLATLLASWCIALVPLALALAWVRSETTARLDLLQMLLAVVLALALALVVALAWPQPRPSTLHLGTQYLDHGPGPGLPSAHVTLLWSLGLASWRSRRFALWGFPMLALGLLVGWSRIYLGAQFPLDIAAALPVAWAGTMVAAGLRGRLRPAFARTLSLHDQWVGMLRQRIRALRKT